MQGPHWASAFIIVAVGYMAFFDSAAAGRPVWITALIVVFGLVLLVVLNAIHFSRR